MSLNDRSAADPVVIVGAGLAGLTVALHPGGTAAGPQQAALLESSRGEQLRVEVSALGRARVCATRGAWPSVPNCS